MPNDVERYRSCSQEDQGDRIEWIGFVADN